MGMSFIVAIPAAAAVVLTLIGRGLVARSNRDDIQGADFPRWNALHRGEWRTTTATYGAVG